MPRPTFIPLVIGAPTTLPPTDVISQAQPQEVRIALRGSAFAATVIWPVSSSAECAADGSATVVMQQQFDALVLGLP